MTDPPASPLAPASAFVSAPLLWEERARAEARGRDPGGLTPRLDGVIARQPLYRAGDRPAGIDEAPGTGSFRRGPLPVCAMPEALPPILLQQHADTDLDRLAAALHEDVAGGVTGLWIDLDRSGVSEGRPLRRVLADVPVAALRRLALDGGADGTARLVMVERWADDQRLDPALLALSLRLDPLGTLLREGSLAEGIDGAMGDLASTTRRCLETLPAALPITLSAGPVDGAGGSIEQSLGWLLADLAFVLRSLDAAGLPLDRVAPRIELHLPLPRDAFGGIAAQRALRVASTALLRAFGLHAPPPLRVHAQASERTLTRDDPANNVLRGTNAVFAALLGGADALTVTPLDALLGVPDRRSRRVARNTALVLAEESHLGRVVDPAGGAHYIEALTESLAQAGWAELQAIEGAGGAGAVVSGWLQERVKRRRAERDARVARRSEAITGVSEFPALRSSRAEERPAAPARLPGHPGASSGPAQGAVRVPAMAPHRDAAPWEDLRARNEARRPAPFATLVTQGDEAGWSARAQFVQNLLAAAGLACRWAADPDRDALLAAVQADPPCFVCLIAADADHAEFVARLAPRLAPYARLVLAGRPGPDAASFATLGVRDHLFLGGDVLRQLRVLSGATP